AGWCGGDALPTGGGSRARPDRGERLAAVPATPALAAHLLSSAHRGLRDSDCPGPGMSKDEANGSVGYVLRFGIDDEFLGHYEVHAPAAGSCLSTGSRPRNSKTSTTTSSDPSRSSRATKGNRPGRSVIPSGTSRKLFSPEDCRGTADDPERFPEAERGSASGRRHGCAGLFRAA